LKVARRDAIVMAGQTRRAWLDFVDAECEACPVLLVLEDLQWADPASVDLVDAAIARFPDRPLMVLALARPEVHDRFPRLWVDRGIHQLRLAPLTKRASERLAREALGDVLNDKIVAAIVGRAGGNAFVLEELISAAVADPETPRSEAAAVILPETVIAMLQARLEGVRPELRRVLRAASIFEDRFVPAGINALLGESTLHGGGLPELLEAKLVSKRSSGACPDDDEYGFGDSLLRAAVYSTLTDHDRALGHRLASAWQRSGGTVAPGESPTLSAGSNNPIG
jgi:predicted ATPase